MAVWRFGLLLVVVVVAVGVDGVVGSSLLFDLLLLFVVVVASSLVLSPVPSCLTALALLSPVLVPPPLTALPMAPRSLAIFSLFARSISNRDLPSSFPAVVVAVAVVADVALPPVLPLPLLDRTGVRLGEMPLFVPGSLDDGGRGLFNDADADDDAGAVVDADAAVDGIVTPASLNSLLNLNPSSFVNFLFFTLHLFTNNPLLLLLLFPPPPASKYCTPLTLPSFFP